MLLRYEMAKLTFLQPLPKANSRSLKLSWSWTKKVRSFARSVLSKGLGSQTLVQKLSLWLPTLRPSAAIASARFGCHRHRDLHCHGGHQDHHHQVDRYRDRWDFHLQNHHLVLNAHFRDSHLRACYIILQIGFLTWDGRESMRCWSSGRDSPAEGNAWYTSGTFRIPGRSSCDCSCSHNNKKWVWFRQCEFKYTVRTRNPTVRFPKSK